MEWTAPRTPKTPLPRFSAYHGPWCCFLCNLPGVLSLSFSSIGFILLRCVKYFFILLNSRTEVYNWRPQSHIWLLTASNANPQDTFNTVMRHLTLLCDMVLFMSPLCSAGACLGHNRTMCRQGPSAVWSLSPMPATRTHPLETHMYQTWQALVWLGDLILWQIILCILVCWQNTVLWTVKNMQLCILTQ